MLQDSLLIRRKRRIYPGHGWAGLEKVIFLAIRIGTGLDLHEAVSLHRILQAAVVGRNRAVLKLTIGCAGERTSGCFEAEEIGIEEQLVELRAVDLAQLPTKRVYRRRVPVLIEFAAAGLVRFASGHHRGEGAGPCQVRFSGPPGALPLGFRKQIPAPSQLRQQCFGL